MKKVFLTLTMLLFAFVGTMRADEVTIGDPTATTTNSNLPTYSLYEKSFTQQIYTADEIGMAGTINTLTMWLKNSSSYARNLNVYMKEVDETEFASTSAWVSMSDADLVGSFTLANGISSPVETAVDLTTPFEYTGAGSLVICFNDVTGSWSSGAASVVMSTTEYQALYAYRDGTSYNPANPGVTGTRIKSKSVIKLDITPAGPGGALTTTPDVLDLGARPNGAWMAPYVFTINGTGTTVNALDFSGNYFTYNAELPATLTASRPLEVTLTTGEAEEGEVNSTMTVLFSGRDAQQFNVRAYAYDPVDGDVFEHPIVANLTPRTDITENLPDSIYHNYDNPAGTDAKDAVYQLTFDEDVLFFAGAEGGNVYLYTQDFNGEPGPMADNNYVYTGPEVGPGPMNMWFSYNYTGTNTFFGSSAGGGMIFGYRITPAQLQELGLGNCAITTVEAAAREGSYYDLVILKGGDTPDLNNMVYYQAFDNYEPFYFFDVNLDEPQFLGDDENIWVMFYSDSPYAAYCGKQPVDVTNGKIWYTTNLSTWYSSTTYTPVIYTRFLELPTGREVTVNLADMKIRESKGATGEIAAVDGNVMNVAKAQMRSRDALELTVHDGSATNSYVPVYGFYADAYNKCEMVYPAEELSEMEGGTINSLTLYASTPAAEAWTGTFQVFMAEAANATISDFAGPGTVVYEGLLDGTGSSMTITFDTPYEYNGGNLLIGVYQTATGNYKSVTWAGESVTGASGTGYSYSALSSCAFTQRNFLPKTTFTYEVASTPEPPTPVYVPYVPNFSAEIDGMYVPAGNYYLVVASDGAQVNMAYADVPAPEQAIVYAPYDGETNVTAPYLAEWKLGDYTTEMQVLVGTQYPPQTALIDWTTNLVESAFIMDLEPNQSYFMQVNCRNAAGTTEGEIIAFTTPIDGVNGFAVENNELYPGDAAVFTWDANRSFQGYNLYMDGVKVNDAVITENTYAVEDLAYNMNGYQFAVTAVYDAGESGYSDIITVYMTGNGTVSGHVYDTDDEHPIANATIEFRGTDEYGEEQVIPATADAEGAYEAEVLVGNFTPYLVMEGYAEIAGPAVIVANEGEYEDIDIFAHEYYYPLQQITATEEENDVLVEWSWTPAEYIVDFETGDLSQAEFTLPATYPWAITNTNAHEGTYAIKSTCEGIASGTSEISVTVNVPFDGKMGFWVKVSSEANYDKFHFFIDGVEKGAAISGVQAYAYKEFDVTEGTHTYKWQYAKDSSVNSNDDCAYVDDITLYRYEAPLPPVVGATVYDFDDSSMQGWTTIDANNDNYDWVLGSQIGGIYLVSGASLAGSGHDSSADMVCSGSYSNATNQAITPDNYLVSPQISAENGAQIHFWACAQDASYAAEHFGVAVSTTNNTSASAFTMVQEWTMSAKGVRGADAETANYVRGSRAQGAWYEYSVDLSAYAGQNIYVAIRHFNCNDQFILNVDDITLATGGAKMAPRDRSLVSYNLYRRNLVVSEEPGEPIAEGIDAETYEYVDAQWPTLDYGEWQWGIAATYSGYAPVDRNRETATFGFENGSLEGWTNIIVNTDGGEWIHSNNNLGGYDYTELAHTGSGFAMCYSYVDYDGPYDTDALLVSPQKYSVDANSSISFWADNANDSYPENFSVCVSTAATPTAASFTEVWSGGAKGTGNGGAAVRHDNNRYENWRSHEVSLAAYAGQEVWIAFRDVNYDMYEIWIDDVTITYAGSAPVPPTPGPTGSGISEILWSNVIEKDMEATLTFNISLNNGQSPAGATIAIVGEDNTYNAVAEGATTEVVVRKGDTYEITVALDGYHYAVNNVYVSDAWTWNGIVEANATHNIELTETIAPVAGLYTSPTGWVMWEGTAAGGVNPNPQPGPGPQPGQDWTEGFENGMPAGWNVIDGNNDGWTWCLTSAIPTTWTYYASMTLDWYRTGSNAICSGSYINGVGALNPNEYLVMGQQAIANGTTLSFWAAATDASYPADHFGVFVSDDASTWTSVQEWTLTAKSNGEGGRASRDGNGAKLGTWYQYTADLSAHAGTKYVAIRHFNCTDQYIMCVDDIEFTTGSKGERAPIEYVVKLDGKYDGTTTNPFFQHNVEGFEEGSTHTTEVRTVYLTGHSEWVEYEWTYTSCENFTGVTNLAAAAEGDNVKLTWTMPEGGTPGPGPQPGQGASYSFDTDLEGWTLIDNDNDGHNWYHSSAAGNHGTMAVTSHSGAGHVMGESYCNNSYAALTPDDYMIAPEQFTVGAGSSVSFWACTQDVSYPSEHFGIAVSTTNNTSASAFTIVNEWTITAKGTGEQIVGRDSKATREGSWYQFNADLSAYAGQSIWIAIRHFNCSDMFIVNVDDVVITTGSKGDRDMWDLVHHFDATSGYQYGVGYDGQNIYTSSWSASSTSMFYKYDLQGNFIEEFNISGCGQIRDLTYDGQYFYGVANASTVYCIDLANHSLVSQFTTSYGAMRCITYDPVRDGFWVVGNWSGNLTLIDRTGAIVQAAGAPTSASGVAYYKDPENVEHIFYLKNETANGEVYEYNITNNTMGTTPVYNCVNTPGISWTGSSGGCFVGTYEGKTCLFADAQQSPQLICIYELDSNSTPGPNPQPGVEGVLGAMIFRDGEWLAFVEGSNASQYVVADAAGDDAEYGVRVVYDGELDVTYYAMSCMATVDYTGTGVSCDPVTNLTAEDYNYQGNNGALVQFTEPEGATSYKVYVDGTLLGSLSAQPIFINFEGTPNGTYQIGIVAVYADCESEMATVDFVWTLDAVNDNAIVTALYPNPTNSDVTIKAAGMNHITVVNALGQVMYDADVDADELQLNLGQYNAGIYMVRISTENGVSTQRVIVTK